MAVQIVGAYFDDRAWNQEPVRVDRRPQRALDWTDPQIVRGMRSGWHGMDLAPVLWQAFATRENAALRFPVDVY